MRKSEMVNIQAYFIFSESKHIFGCQPVFSPYFVLDYSRFMRHATQLHLSHLGMDLKPLSDISAELNTVVVCISIGAHSTRTRLTALAPASHRDRFVAPPAAGFRIRRRRSMSFGKRSVNYYKRRTQSTPEGNRSDIYILWLDQSKVPFCLKAFTLSFIM